MAADRKRKASETQSAISKLRKAREAATQVGGRKASPIHQPARAHGNGIARPKPTTRSRSAVSVSGSLSEPPQTSDNSFTVLPYKQTLDGNRIYERLTNSRLRVELADGAGCVVLGRCTIWVKHGSISVLGAILKASPVQHHLSAPNIVALPTIEALDGVAEFELGTTNFGRHAFSANERLYRIPQEYPEAKAQADLSFCVLGLDFQPGTTVPRQMPILTLGETHFGPLESRQGPATTLLYGPRSSGITTLARCLLNRAVTATTTGECALLLDLDPDLPEASLPGTIAVSKVTAPFLGPLFSQPSHPGVKILRAHFVGSVTDSLQPSSWHQSCLENIFRYCQDLRKQYPRAPLIILAGESLRFCESLRQVRLWKDLNITSLTYVESAVSHSNIERLRGFSDRCGLPMSCVPSLNENPHTSRQHQLRLQAYLGERPIGSGNSGVWGQHAGDNIGADGLELIYSGPQALLKAVALLEGKLPPRYAERALPGMVVAFTLVEMGRLDTIQRLVTRCSTSRLPLLPSISSLGIEASDVDCLGLVIVKAIDVEKGILRLSTPLAETIGGCWKKQGHGIMLVVQPPTINSRFSLGLLHK